jgi:hypothetical protein
MPHAGRIVAQDGDHCQLVLNHLFLTYTVGPATRAKIASMVANLDEFFGGLSADARGAYILVTRATAKPPEAESRAAVERAFDRHRQQLAAVAIVVEVPGFGGAALRAVASTLFLLSSAQLPVKFFAHAAECISWVSTTADASADDVRALLKQAAGLVTLQTVAGPSR